MSAGVGCGAVAWRQIISTDGEAVDGEVIEWATGGEAYAAAAFCFGARSAQRQLYRKTQVLQETGSAFR